MDGNQCSAFLYFPGEGDVYVKNLEIFALRFLEDAWIDFAVDEFHAHCVDASRLGSDLNLVFASVVFAGFV